MKINEICKKLNITKKAIIYYEKQGLISLPKDDNGYRVFDTSHLNRLREITLYRKLLIATKDIKSILDSDSKAIILRKIAKEKQFELEKLESNYRFIDKMFDESFDDFNIKKMFNEVSENEIKDENYIMNKFKEAFPGGLGRMLAIHFSNFKFDLIKTDRQKNALINIIMFLDDTEDLELSNEALDLFEDLDSTGVVETLSSVKTNIIDKNISPEKLAEMKKDSEDTLKLLKDQTHDIYETIMAARVKLKVFFDSHAYKKNVIDNMMILSVEYKQYHNRLDVLGNSYEKMNL